MKSSFRWGIVTMAAGFTAGTLGHYLPAENGVAFFVVFVVSIVFGGMGMAVLDD